MAPLFPTSLVGMHLQIFPLLSPLSFTLFADSPTLLSLRPPESHCSALPKVRDSLRNSSAAATHGRGVGAFPIEFTRAAHDTGACRNHPSHPSSFLSLWLWHPDRLPPTSRSAVVLVPLSKTPTRGFFYPHSLKHAPAPHLIMSYSSIFTTQGI